MSQRSYDERLLLPLIAKGDEIAFKQLYDQYFTRLSAYVFKLCKSASITEDVLQEVFIKLWLNRSVCTPIESAEAYILSIAKNTTIDWLRKLSRQTTLIVDLSTQVAECGNAAENKLSLENLESLITKALSQLSSQKQQVFQLSKVVGFSHDEIADELHLSKSTVKNHLSETLKHIRKHLQPGVASEVLLFLALLSAIQE
ncbi:MAG: RNA polymerase sigma-70 factor [Ferruginibacter sp.]